MQPDLNKVRDALGELLRMNDPRNLPTLEYRLEVFGKCRDALEALTSHLSMSEYDRCVSDLAKYLPDGRYRFSSGALRRLELDEGCVEYTKTIIVGLDIPAPVSGDGRFTIRSGSVVKGGE